jgi:uncharacterized protein involved in exopolysaccharide biosynthesis/Mrp family chromosome partitioning ATPase
MFEAPRQIRSAVVGPGDVTFGIASVAEVDFRRIWSVIWQGKNTILFTTAVALALTFLLILVLPHKYTAVTQILIDPTDLRAVGNEASPTNLASDAGVLAVESEVRVLTSDSVLRRVVAAENLDHDPDFASATSAQRVLIGEFIGALGLSRGPVVTDNTLAALNELKRRLQVKRAERTYVVDVSVSDQNPEKAARIANAVAQAYLAEQTQVRSDAARQVSQSLSARLKDLQDRVRVAEDHVEAYKASNNIVGANGQLVDEQQLSELNNQLSLAHARTAEAKARLDQIESVQHSKDALGSFPEALQSQTITALRGQYAEIMRREAEQTTSLGERHPAVIDIQAQAERLRHMIEDEVNRVALSARSAYESAKADEDALANNLETLKHTTITTNAAMVGLRELERDVQANRAVYEAYLVRARETGEQEQLDTKNIRVISRAELPLHRSSPPSNMLIALAGLLLGVAAGTGIVFMRAPYQEAALLGRPGGLNSSSIPILAVLPDVDISFGLNAAEDPKSRFAREVRNVIEALRGSHNMRGNPSVLVVASDDEDSTVAVALTLAAMVAATQRVLLIDADLDRRTLSALDADQSEAGLVDVAIGRRSLADVIVRDRQTNINLVSFISPNSRRDRQISDEDIKQAFDQTKRFDMVIVAAVDLSRDPATRFFAGLVDHIVLVARADRRRDGAVEQFVSRLGLDARKIRGAVLTGSA